jgi:hypothetical protein
MAYVYRYIRLDKNEPFYIGISGRNDDDNGEYKRAQNIHHYRNPLYENIIKKIDIRVEIVLDNLTYKEACDKEKELIKLYGRIDLNTGCLSNMTDGGDGGTGHVMPESAKEKIRNFQLSLNKKGKPGRVWSEKSKQKLSNTITGIKHSEESKQKMRKPKPPGFSEQLSKLKKELKATCPYCNKTGNYAGMRRWHFNNCKNIIK